MLTTDFVQLMEGRLTSLENRLTEQVDKRLTEEVKNAISFSQVDLPFTLAKARFILEFVIQDVYKREITAKKIIPLFDMIEALFKIDGLFSKKLVSDFHYICVNGNLIIHAKDANINIEEKDVEPIVLIIVSIVEWYLTQYIPLKTGVDLKEPIVSPDEKRVLYFSSFEDNATLWDLETGSKLHTIIETEDITDAVFSPDNRIIALKVGHFNSSQKKIILWDSLSGKRLKEYIFPDIESMEFSRVEPLS